jgi:hypothetical protein
MHSKNEIVLVRLLALEKISVEIEYFRSPIANFRNFVDVFLYLNYPLLHSSCQLNYVGGDPIKGFYLQI